VALLSVNPDNLFSELLNGEEVARV
jgi:hypothetical protein